MTKRDLVLLVAASSALVAMTLEGLRAAELSVTSASNAPGLTVGAKLKDDHVFDLSDKAEVNVIKLPDNATFTLRGPFKGTLQTFVSRCTGALRFTYSHCRNQSAGDQLPVGGTRGIPAPGQ